MIAIGAVQLREIRLPLREPFRISSGSVHERRVLLLEVSDSDGRKAWSECVAAEYPNYSAETVDTAWLALQQWLIPEVLGRRFDHPSDVHRHLESRVRGHRMAKGALEMGCWGLAAELAGVPLARLIGGERESVEVGVSLGIETTADRLAQRATREAKAGYRKIKLKIKPGYDVQFVRAVRDVLPAAALMVDANAAYGPEDTASLLAMDGLGLTMIEQPFSGEDLLRHAALQLRLETPLCLDESITSPARVEDMLSLGSGRIVNVKPGRVGGFTPSLEIHDRCHSDGVPVWCGGMLETGIGRAYNVALASLPGFSMPGDLSPSRRYWERDIVHPEWTMSANGTVEVPTAPGIGVEVDREQVEQLTVRQCALRTSGNS
ncbi:MAG: o-succinylbenzoate synthase [Gemmatimonadota bacterium]